MSVARTGFIERYAPWLLLAAIVVLWQAICSLFDVSEFIFPSPIAIAQSLVQYAGPIAGHAWQTLWTTMAGFAIGVAVGLALGIAVGMSRLTYRALYPLLVGFNSIPKAAFVPILVVWFGIGSLPAVLTAVLICFFPIVVAGMAGLTSTPADVNELAKSLSANWWQHFLKFRFPWALPQIFVGLKVAISLAVVGAVVAEFTGAGHGLGFVIVMSGTSADTPLAFAAISLLAVMSIGLFYLLVAVERRLLPWAKETTG